MNHKTRILLFLLLPFASLVNAQYFVPNNAETNVDHVVTHSQFMGGGAAFFDADNDGDDDLYLTSGQAMDHFYINNGDGSFTLNSEAAGFVMTDTFYTIGVIAGDIDNDGFKDVFVTTRNSDSDPKAQNLLFQNNGDGTFTEIWEQSLFADRAFTMGATFLDFNQDGLLDIYAINYVRAVNFITDPNGNITGFDHECYKNTMYRNEGNGNFVEKSQSLNLIDGGCALAVAATDYDLDGDMDLYIANDFGEFIQPNRLFQNNFPSQFFQSVAPELNADIPMYGMGIAVGDIDGDLDLDYYVTNFGKNRLLRNDLNAFVDITDQSHVGDEWVDQDSTLAIGWGTAFFDFDNDTDLDLYVANGYVPSPSFLPSTSQMNDRLFRCEEDLTYTEVSNNYGIQNNNVSRGMAYSDYDNDGDLDVMSVVLKVPINNEDKRSILFKNQMGNERNWLKIRLEGVEVNRDAFGSKVYLHAGGKTFLRELSGGSSHCSHNSSVLHFGLDDLEMVDSIEVVWTGGQNRQTVYNIEANQTIDIQEDVLSFNEEVKPLLGNVKLYPNPAEQKITIDWSGVEQMELSELSIFNGLGQLIERRFVDPSTSIQELDLSNYPSGLYFIGCTLDGFYWSRSFIVNR